MKRKRDLRNETQARAERFRSDAQAAGERVRTEAREAGERVRTEAHRKAVHMAAIAIPLAIIYLPLIVTRRVLVLLGIALLITDLAKIHQPKIRSYFVQFFGPLIRRHETSEITGSTYLVISALVATYVFEPAVAAAALVFLIIGDTMAALVGKAWGRHKIFDKSWEGFFAGFVSSFLAAWAIVPGISPLALGIAALVAAIVELLPIPVDDNFRIPLLAGLVLEWIR